MTILNALYKVIRASGIQVRWQDCPTPCVTLDGKRGYTIRMPKRLKDLTSEEHKAVLLHELAHVLHGDLLAAQAKENPILWNVACDARINRDALLPPLTNVVRRLKGPEARPIRYDTVRRQAPSLPDDHIPSAVAIYEALHSGRQTGEQDGLLSGHDDMQVDGDPDDIRQRHAETVLKARKAMKDHPDLFDMIGSIGKITTRRHTMAPYNPETLARIDAILSRLEGIDGARCFSRTWIRPRHLGRNTHLRGGAYRPRPKLLVIVDVSGSRAERLDISQALVDACQGRFEAETIAHDVDAKLLQPGEALPAGGGTAFVPAFKLAASRRPDCVVHITDLESHDVEEAYQLVRCPLIVAVDAMPNEPPAGAEIVEV